MVLHEVHIVEVITSVCVAVSEVTIGDDEV